MSFAGKGTPRYCTGPPEPQLWQLRDPKVTLPAPARQSGAKQAPEGRFHVAAMPRQRGGGRCLPCSSLGIPPGDAAMLETAGSPARGCGCQGSIPGRRGKGTLPGGSAEVTNRQRRRLGASSPSPVPLPAPSGEIYRLSKRSEMKATVPTAHRPRREERASLPSTVLLPCGFPCVSRTPLPARSISS